MNADNNITGIILAGGKSTRMGTDKGLLKIENKTFVACVIDAVKPLVDDIIIVSDNPDYDQFGFKRIDDIIKEAGPVAGLYAGLKHSKTDDNLVLSCDVPMISTEVLGQLLKPEFYSYEVVQIQSNGKTMPLIARYKKDCLTTCYNLLMQGERRLRLAVSQFNTKSVLIDEKHSDVVKNVNTKEDLETINYDIER
ncbi:MAG: molybdenum cofactor guanylyltransferase [Flavobacteriaceae bacterium]|jgi:molybdopterin-guanine dinucleotide biosynthesis protein A|nr:molybdenum cofactor guanylyltransferase [Flavobacteriaceae bacterium]